MRKLIVIFIFISTFTVYGQSDLYFSFIPEEKYRVIERSDYRIRVNGVYKGHIYNQNRGILEVSREQDGSYSVNGNYYIFEELTKDGYRNASKIDEVNHSSFSLYSSGEMIVDRNETYPLLRSFPNYDNEPKVKGDSWVAFSEKVILQNGTKTMVPIYCQYFYDGPGKYNGVDVHNIRAKYAVRYNRGDDPDGNENLKNISGTHDVSIIIEMESGKPILIRDNMNEKHTFVDGGSLEKTGFILTFFKGITGMEKAVLAEKLREEFDEELLKDVEISDSAEGIKLTLNQLHFLPDQAVILREDTKLLDSIADSLKKIQERTFFVKGHTADVGSVESQLDLSLKRAFVVVRELIKRGVPEDRFLYMGSGGSEPVASNETDEGRAKNRRVEIIILED
ncbi:MAG: OmpA family protein [Spirochaetaceae bacterium]|jgi:OOP family OmpA-OmpF porin|nr:OmpA family protein [Spirochaetaceae bacterium]